MNNLGQADLIDFTEDQPCWVLVAPYTIRFNNSTKTVLLSSYL